MHVKTLIASLAFGSLLMACGPEAGLEAHASDAPALATTEQGLCEGWDDGARRCSIKCTSTSGWITLDTPIAKGHCQETANSFCGRTAYGACWSY
ncbi:MULTISPECIES: hypothetical protein [unclassified Corallococcus]|uniref:hypothetical protein n=1 Tax=unclassified Corallococcus TaxID=2685029 RepID=UPI001A904A73|nr:MULTISPECIES: hypothetical protein [unclassified Corallococcus]MBN9685821.1 hypothetical protein [Corallococcus sp. NCSPR001]WAS82737.1 hypothetical protein O0N60_25830 [Corallococcus sp. NCRR]